MAATYLLDTNILSAMMRGDPRLLNRVAGLAANRLPLSAFVLAEIHAGAEMGTRKARTLAAFRELTADMPLLPFDAGDAAVFGRIRGALERKNAAVGTLDMLIASQAVARGLVLVTDNVKDFKRVPGLTIENWLR